MRRYILLGALMMVAASAAAEGVSYDYIGASYLRISLDGPGNVDGDGIGVGGSFAFGESWHGFAGFGTADLGFGVDFDEFVIGAGYHTGITEQTDVFAELSYVDLKVSANGFGSFGDNGIGMSVGVRGMLTERVELGARANYVDLGAGGDGTSLGLDGWYEFGRRFALGLEADFEDDGDTFGVGFRWYFKK